MTASTSLLFRWSVPQLRSAHIRTVSVLCAHVESQPVKSYARAVKPVKIKLITVAKGNSQGTEVVARKFHWCSHVSSKHPFIVCAINAGEWTDKVKRYTQLEHLQVKPNPKKAASPQVAVQAEGEKVLKHLMPQVTSKQHRVLWMLMSLLKSLRASERIVLLFSMKSRTCC